MDPVVVKFAQLLLAEVLGGALVLLGVYLFLRGVSGKSSLLVEGAGIKAKLTNATPGALVLIAGVALVFFSLSSKVERTEKESTNPVQIQQTTLDLWLERSATVSESQDYGQTVDKVLGSSPDARVIVETKHLRESTTLGRLAAKEYGASKYWRILAVANKDRGYYKLSHASEVTPLANGIYVEIWQVSKLNGVSRETRIQISTADKLKAYEEMLRAAEAGSPFSPEQWIDRLRPQDLDVVYSEADTTSTKNLRELSLKYYGDPKFWRLIVWANQNAFPSDVAPDVPVPQKNELYVLHIVP